MARTFGPDQAEENMSIGIVMVSLSPRDNRQCITRIQSPCRRNISAGIPPSLPVANSYSRMKSSSLMTECSPLDAKPNKTASRCGVTGTLTERHQRKLEDAIPL